MTNGLPWGRCAGLALLVIALALAGCYAPMGENLSRNPTHSSVWVRSASFSPDGELMLVEFSAFKIEGIFLVNREGVALRQLCGREGRESCHQPSFSPDGALVAFSRGPALGPRGIYIINQDGSGLRRLTESTLYDTNPVFSPDGQRVYFIRQRPLEPFEKVPDAPLGLNFADGDIFYVDLRDGSEHRVTRDHHMDMRGLCMMPDGRHALFTANTPAFTAQGHTLWKVDLNDPSRKWPMSPDLSHLASDPRIKPTKAPPYISTHDPVLSRDGRFLAFTWAKPSTKTHGEAHQVYITQLSNGRTGQFTNLNANVNALAFSPDGRSVLFGSWPCQDDYGADFFPHTNLWEWSVGGNLRNIPLDFRGLAGQTASPAQAKK